MTATIARADRGGPDRPSGRSAEGSGLGVAVREVGSCGGYAPAPPVRSDVGASVAVDLPHGWQTLVDEADLPLVQSLTLYRGTNGYVYFARRTNGRPNPGTLHSVLMGGSRAGYHIDHINGDKLDNRRANLRFVTPSQNQVNRRAPLCSSSGHRGVTPTKNGKAWRAQITVNRRQIHLGVFEDLQEAVTRRRMAELKYFGELCPVAPSPPTEAA